MKCPCCHSEIAHEGLPVDALNLTPQQQAMLRALMRRGDVLPSRDLADKVYDGADGGPDDYTVSISRLAQRLRRKIEPCGWTIVAHRGWGGGYRLQRMQG